MRASACTPFTRAPAHGRIGGTWDCHLDEGPRHQRLRPPGLLSDRYRTVNAALIPSW